MIDDTSICKTYIIKFVVFELRTCSLKTLAILTGFNYKYAFEYVTSCLIFYLNILYI